MPSPRRVVVLIETDNSYSRGLLRGVVRYNREHGQWLMYFEPHGQGAPPPWWLKGWKGDGILSQILNRSAGRKILRAGVPVVDLRGFVPDIDVPVIRVDNEEVVRLALDHLTERGLEHFAFCGDPRGRNVARDERHDHFKRLVKEAGYRPRMFPAGRTKGQSWEQQNAEISRWIDSLPKPVGVMCSHDTRGLQVLGACRWIGVEVPDEVAVISADNDEFSCGLSTPPMTSIDLNPQRIGYEAAALLDRLMDGHQAPAGVTFVPPGAVVTRQSTDIVAADDPEVSSVLQHIRAHACEGLQVKEVVQWAPLPRVVLAQRFRLAVGRTMHEEIQRVRLEQVKLLLATTRLPIKQVARRCGFNYVEYLTRLFRRVTGQTPAQYRRHIQV